ncbi:predicted protein [Micromonas commoda]|uniref:CBS domain-containing protein n=1 Tax=Micromonas commoda (strain RCC299 / NOUM17 / CCMP2709) TaxID=296587 RepID=C1E4T6_MICCC|nr:predicted protein [Micromonas commoda]ACO62776.1 predicted protein [Micromonas commoda]|eukprot:XP_002501518.1 predicted protein [Micromonas commoda]
MEGDASTRFPPDDRIPDVPANDPIPSGELIDARYFLSGWTLARYTERFRRESGDGEASSADDLGDGATPVGSGAFGWTAEGPPGRRRARRRRPRGVLTIPTRATVGQALRDLAAADVLAAPAVDAATGEYAGWISVGSLLEQILGAMYPALLDPEFVSQAG